jgi:hypothetical protein
MRDSWTQITTRRPEVVERGSSLGQEICWASAERSERPVVASGLVYSRSVHVAVGDVHSFEGTDAIEVGDLLHDGF